MRTSEGDHRVHWSLDQEERRSRKTVTRQPLPRMSFLTLSLRALPGCMDYARGDANCHYTQGTHSGAVWMGELAVWVGMGTSELFQQGWTRLPSPAGDQAQAATLSVLSN